MTAARNRWFRSGPRSEPVAQHLVCFPHAGGTARAFSTWSGRVGPGVEVLAVQYPGRQDRLAEPAIDNMAELAGQLAAAVEADCAGPVSLFGHSMGAVVAYEVAVLLEQSGRTLDRLFVSGRTTGTRTPVENNHGLNDEDLVAAIRRLGGADAQVFEFPKLWPVILPPLRTDLMLLDRYRPDAMTRLSCPVTAYAGASDHTCPAADLGMWAGATSAEFEMSFFPGGHHYLAHEEPAVLGSIAQRLRSPDRDAEALL